MKRYLLSLILGTLVMVGYSQTIRFSAGAIRSSTLWDIGILGNSVTTSILEPKVDLAFNLGFEFLEKEHTSFSANIGYYRSGGKLAIFEVKEARPAILWDFKNDRYLINCLSLNSNFNLSVFKQNKSTLDAIVGVHLDYILEDKIRDVMDNGTKWNNESPIQTLYMQNALNQFNYGPTIGARYTWTINNFNCGIEYLLCPRMNKLGEKNTTDDPNGIALSVTEKVSFTQLTFGYKLKNK